MKTVNVVWKFKRQHGVRPLQYNINYSDERWFYCGNHYWIPNRKTIAV